RVLILGTGEMANTHATAYRNIDHCEVVGGVDNNKSRLNTFCDTHGIAHRFTSIESALEWNGFDAVSNVTPDGVHYRTTLPVIAAGKHVLCEKPLTVNTSDAQAMADAANTAGIVNGVNLSYRSVPAMQKAAAMVAAGDIGTVRHFEASYLQSWLTQNAWGDWKSESQWLWRLSSAHGSNGVLGDVGIHIIDFATFVAGSLPVRWSSMLHTFDKVPGNIIDHYQLDANDSFVMHAQLGNGALGTISASRFASGHLNDLRLRIYGTDGGLEVLFEKGISRLRGCLAQDLPEANWYDIDCPAVPDNYQRFIAAIQQGRQGPPDFNRGAELQHLIDQMLQEQPAQ
ncbi:MAG: Gfo/Idh/MocA family oxidoreductase, partial [Pseudomonadota bacterium]